jgi:hypothetical protein
MTKINSTPVAELEVGQAYNVVSATNALGQPMTNIRRHDWRAVLMTSEALAHYADTGSGVTYYFQPIKDRHTVRLLAAGWTKLRRSQGECGLAIVAGSLKGLACAKPAYWTKDGVSDGVVCAQHGITYL